MDPPRQAFSGAGDHWNGRGNLDCDWVATVAAEWGPVVS
jgi:hypothetical protein